MLVLPLVEKAWPLRHPTQPGNPALTAGVPAVLDSSDCQLLKSCPLTRAAPSAPALPLTLTALLRLVKADDTFSLFLLIIESLVLCL